MLTCGHSASSSSQDDTTHECALCDRRQMPTKTSLGRQTPTFRAGSVPDALLATHRTTAWAELIVATGSVRFVESDSGWSATATPDHVVVIVPNRFHYIEPSANAVFHIQFHKLPE